MVFIPGRMDANTMDSGMMENNMVEVNIIYKMAHLNKDFGKKERGLNG